MPEAAPDRIELVWETDMRLLSHPTMLGQFGLVVGLSGGIMALLMTFLLAVQGEWEGIPAMLLISLCAAGGLALLMLLVILLFFGNRIRMRFTLGERGVAVEMIDRRARGANRLAVLAGMLGASPATAGAGMMALSRESEFRAWRGIAEARYDARRHSITLRNRWRTVAFLACTPENYTQVEALVRAHVAPAPQDAAKEASPLPRLLGRTLLVVLAALPVFVLPYPFELDLLAPLIMLCFALATVWLIPLFGWVVIASALWLAAEIVVIAFESHESIFTWRGTYRNYEILNGGDWAALAVAAVGLGYLILFSWRAARGRYLSALAADEAELADDE
jgi:hypothetical protein